MLSARVGVLTIARRPPLGSAWAYVLFCVTTAIMYFYVAAWSAAEGRAYWLPMACCIGYLVATLQDRVSLPALRLAVPPLMAAPIAFHLGSAVRRLVSDLYGGDCVGRVCSDECDSQPLAER